jgi:hypothetical protein
MYYGDNAWRERVRESLISNCSPPRERPTTLQDRSGGIREHASEKLRTCEELASAERDISHIEMELSGVYRASRRRGGTVPVPAIRGLSDIIGQARSPGPISPVTQLPGLHTDLLVRDCWRLDHQVHPARWGRLRVRRIEECPKIHRVGCGTGPVLCAWIAQ